MASLCPSLPPEGLSTDQSLHLQGKSGIAVVKTKQAILVGHYPENVQAGNATTVIEALADYMISTGY